MHRVIRRAWVSVAASAAVSVAAGETPRIDLAGLLVRVGDRVEAYYTRAQSILCLETVRLQPLAYDLSSDGRTRTLVYELRVSWEPASDAGAVPEANVLRQLRTVDGRPPKEGDEPGCTDPKPVSLDPLSFLLALHQREYVFSFKGSGRTGGRAAVMLDYASAGSPPAEITWRGTCVTMSLPSRTKGRVWIDAASGDVLRLDEHVAGPYEVAVPAATRRPFGLTSLILDRADSSIRYKPVTFRDPDETVILPESIESITVARGSAIPRLRTTQTFSSYQRFVTDARIVR